MQIILTANYSPWSAYSGGGQRSTHNLASTFHQRGHDVTVIYSKSWLEKDMAPDTIPYKIRWATLYNVKSFRNDILRPLSSISVAKIANDIIDKNADTIIHSNGEEGGQIHTLFKKHNFGFIATPRYSAYPAELANYKSKNIIGKAAFMLAEGKYVMQAKAIEQSHFCCPPSQWAADKIQSILSPDPKKMKPVANGVPKEFLAYHRSPEAVNGPIIFFGRFAYDKGVDTLIEALSMYPKSKLPPVHIIGRGNLEMQLKDSVKECGLSDKIIFKDWMNHHELGRELSKARMTVLPSRDENFSLAILSSMCVGSPTISTSVGGTPEIIDHKKTGYLVPPSNPEELRDSIGYYLDNPQKREHIAHEGSNYIRQKLTWEATCAKFEKLYEQALNLSKA